MKQILLSLAMIMTAGGAFAQDVDVTPSKYKYADKEVGQEAIDGFVTGSNIAAPCDKLIEEKYNNGLFYVAGGQFGNTAQPYAKDLQAGTSIVDLGGEVGKVLCINGKNSKFNETYNVKFPQCTGTLNWFNFNWFMDPKNTPTISGKEVSDATRNIRVRVVLNVYSNKPDEAEGEIISAAYMVSNQGNVMPAESNKATGAKITTGEFIKTFDDGTPEEGPNGDYVYNPTKWMVYEWDTYCPTPVDEQTGVPLRLKMEMKAPNLAGSTVFIKEVSFTKLGADAKRIEGNKRSKTFLTLKQAVATGINSINASASNGVKEIYTLNGTRVNAGTQLGQGLYIVKEGGKTTKMVIK